MDLEEGEVLDSEEEGEGEEEVDTKFFNEKTISEYITHLNRSGNPLGGKQILTWKQLSQKMMFEYDDDMEAFQLDFINTFSNSNICGTSVDSSYLYNIFMGIVDNDTKYDVVFLYDESEIDSSNEFAIVIGVMIVKKWRCDKYPNAYVLDIICSNAQSNVRSNGKLVSNGALLLGLYMYSILNSNAEKVGILEVANGYKNISGLCLYTKFGFHKDKSLYSRYCFRDLVNTSMIAHVEEIGKQKIVDIVTNRDNGYQKDMLCNIRDKQVQQLTGTLLNLRDMFDYSGEQDKVQELTSEINEIFNNPDSAFTNKHQMLHNKYTFLYTGLKNDDKYYISGGKRRKSRKRLKRRSRKHSRKYSRKN